MLGIDVLTARHTSFISICRLVNVKPTIGWRLSPSMGFFKELYIKFLEQHNALFKNVILSYIFEFIF